MTREFVYEIRIAANNYGGQWYPIGSDTPIPTDALVEVYDDGVVGPEDLQTPLPLDVSQ